MRPRLSNRSVPSNDRILAAKASSSRCARRGGRRSSWIGGVLLPLLVPLACGGSSGGDGVVSVQVDNGRLTVVVVSDCPPCDALATDTAYGRFQFSSNVTNQTAQSILDVCGFQHVSDTPLQIRGCAGGVELGFVSNRFSAFALRRGFQGRFAASIRIGDSLESVIATDPRFVQVDPLTFVRDDGDTRVEANFDADLRLRELVVGRGFVR